MLESAPLQGNASIAGNDAIAFLTRGGQHQ
jgi:hypothetical protein